MGFDSRVRQSKGCMFSLCRRGVLFVCFFADDPDSSQSKNMSEIPAILKGPVCVRLCTLQHTADLFGCLMYPDGWMDESVMYYLSCQRFILQTPRKSIRSSVSVVPAEILECCVVV